MSAIAERPEIGLLTGAATTSPMEAEIAGGCARLRTFRAMVPTHSDLQEHELRTYSSILNRLEQLSGLDLSSYRITLSEVGRRIASRGFESRRGYGDSDNSYCERQRLYFKIDGLIRLFSAPAESRGRLVTAPSHSAFRANAPRWN